MAPGSKFRKKTMRAAQKYSGSSATSVYELMRRSGLKRERKIKFKLQAEPAPNSKIHSLNIRLIGRVSKQIAPLSEIS